MADRVVASASLPAALVVLPAPSAPALLAASIATILPDIRRQPCFLSRREGRAPGGGRRGLLAVVGHGDGQCGLLDTTCGYSGSRAVTLAEGARQLRTLDAAISGPHHRGHRADGHTEADPAYSLTWPGGSTEEALPGAVWLTTGWPVPADVRQLTTGGTMAGTYTDQWGTYHWNLAAQREP